MSDRDLTAEELFFLRLSREGKAKSRAMPRHRYGDPAKHVKFEREGGRTMQRDLEEVEELLLKWADWMRGADLEKIGYPSKSLGVVESWIRDNEELVDAALQYQMGKVNATIDSLIEPHQRIIYKRHNIGFKVWRFSDEEGLYLAAKAAFAKKYFYA